MRISSIVRAVEDQVIGASSKLAAAGSQLYRELALEATARHAVNVELRAAKAQMIADFKEALTQTDKLHTQREGD